MLDLETRILDLLCEVPDPWAVAEALVDEEVSRGEYEGCSTELEMQFSWYKSEAERILAAAGGR